MPLGDLVGERLHTGIQTGSNKAFIFTDRDRNHIVDREPAASALFLPLVRGPHIKAWQIERRSEWLLYIPWHFPFSDENAFDNQFSQAETEFAKVYPVVFAHLSAFKESLAARIGREKGYQYEWYSLTRPRKEYIDDLQRPKIILPAISTEPSFAWDNSPSVIDNSAHAIFANRWLLPLLNSPVAVGFLNRTCSQLRGTIRLSLESLKRVPVPQVQRDRQEAFEALADLVTTAYAINAEGQTELMEAGPVAEYFRQWMNGLVYELYLPKSFRSQSIRLFEETVRFLPRDINSKRGAEAARVLLDVFSRAYELSSPLRSMLFAVAGIPQVRMFEGMLT